MLIFRKFLKYRLTEKHTQKWVDKLYLGNIYRFLKEMNDYCSLTIYTELHTYIETFT